MSEPTIAEVLDLWGRLDTESRGRVALEVARAFLRVAFVDERLAPVIGGILDLRGLVLLTHDTAGRVRIESTAHDSADQDVVRLNRDARAAVDAVLAAAGFGPRL